MHEVEDGGEAAGRAPEGLLALPVRVRGIKVGRIVDALVDPSDERIIGFEVLCGDGVRRFLPYPVARIRGGEVEVDSPLALLDPERLDYYRARTRRLFAA